MSLKTIIYLLWPVLFFFSYSCTAQDKLYAEFYDQALPQIINKESTDSVNIVFLVSSIIPGYIQYGKKIQKEYPYLDQSGIS